ncbi:MAG: hypothetical protein AVDCRST_MAG30-4078, partial [uncultured Solirubrobacteraceae bacterium]
GRDDESDAGGPVARLGGQRDQARGGHDGRGRQPDQRAGDRRAAGAADPRRDGHGLPRGGHARARSPPGPLL